MEKSQHWLQPETSTSLLINVLTTSRIPLAPLPVVFENEREFLVHLDVFSIHQSCLQLPIADGILLPTTRQEISQYLIS